jgi:hypothetical protein
MGMDPQTGQSSLGPILAHALTLLTNRTATQGQQPQTSQAPGKPARQPKKKGVPAAQGFAGAKSARANPNEGGFTAGAAAGGFDINSMLDGLNSVSQVAPTAAKPTSAPNSLGSLGMGRSVTSGVPRSMI